MFTLICARINGWVNNREAGDLRRYRLHYDVIVMNSGLAILPLNLGLGWEIAIRSGYVDLGALHSHFSDSFRVSDH